MTLNDDFALFGTPLDPIDVDEGPKKKPVPIEQQVVTDENGRRRFHGAFTGGFSAGFFNTVGTKEGWMPSEFTSSRATKADAHKQKPEDYMDDEDMGEYGFAPQKLKTSSKFHNDPKNQRKPEPGDNSFLSHALMENVFKASKETIGYELLSKMGWRPGKGIGPRLTKLDRKRKMVSHNKLYQGKSADGTVEVNKDEEDEFTEKYKDFLFAPDELPIEMVNPKENLQGIGYKGLEKTSVLGNLSISSGHFNLFDIGPEKGPSVTKNRPKNMKIRGQAFGVGAYEEDDEDIYGKDDMSNYDFSLPTQQEERFQNRPKRESRWDPGPSTDVIEGFELDLSDAASILLKKVYPPPIVPKGWQPKLGRKTTRFDVDKPTTTNPTPSERRNLVTDVVAEPPPPSLPSTTMEQLNDLLAENSAMTDTNFKPFVSNPEKQLRYEKYLVCVKNNRGDALRLLQPKFMTEWERDRERVEFERAAILYQPLNTAMSKRFVSAGLSQEADAVKKEEVPEDDVKRAVSMKLFGKLTRERVEWHPAKLLCVRFNVKQPYAGDMIGVPLNQRTKFDIFGRLERDENSSKSGQSDPERGNETKALEMTEEPQLLEIKEEDVDETEQSKPPLDLFKSIFANSDSEESEPEEEPTVDTPAAPSVVVPAAESAASGPSKKIATGLFANIDFDKLNQRASTTTKPPPALAPEKPKAPEKPNDSLRGPTLEPKAPEVNQPDEDFEWVEKTSNGEAKSRSRKKKKKDSKGPRKSSDHSSDDDRSRKKSRKRRSSLSEDERSRKKSSHKKKKHNSRDRSMETTSKRSKSKSSKQKKKSKTKKRREDDSSD